MPLVTEPLPCDLVIWGPGDMSTTTKAMPVEVAGPVAAEQSAPGRSRLAIGLVVALTIAYTPCAADSHARLVADYDNLTAADRAWLRDLGRRAWTSPGDVTEAERQRADRMEAEHLRVGVFVTPRICGEWPTSRRPRPPRRWRRPRRAAA